MNNTKSIFLVVIITATLVLGTSVIPMQSYADRGNSDDKQDKDFESKIRASSVSDKKSASQKMDQDNFCYRSDDCQQANQGQQIVGKDNEAKGFNDQSLNVQQAATPTPPPTQPPTPTPEKATLNVCKEVVSNMGIIIQPSDFTFDFSTPANPSTFQGANEGCTAVTVAAGTYIFQESTDRTGIRSIETSTSGGCDNPFDRDSFTGTIAAGETQTCTITNTVGA
jgi:hypothetical protein